MNKIDEIKQALSAATPGPWSLEEGWADSPMMVMRPGGNVPVAELSFENCENDGNLIANAPEYIAWLLKEDQGLQEDIMVLKDMVHTKKKENERLHMELEEAQRSNDVMAKYLNELLHNTSNMVTASQVVNVLREAIGREEFDPVGQEGEGNQ